MDKQVKRSRGNNGLLQSEKDATKEPWHVPWRGKGLEHGPHSLSSAWGREGVPFGADEGGQCQGMAEWLNKTSFSHPLCCCRMIKDHINLSCQPTQRQPGHTGTWANTKCNRNENVLPASSFIYKYWNDKLSALPDACKEQSFRSKSSSNGIFYLEIWKEGSITSQ